MKTLTVYNCMSCPFFAEKNEYGLRCMWFAHFPDTPMETSVIEEDDEGYPIHPTWCPLEDVTIINKTIMKEKRYKLAMIAWAGIIVIFAVMAVITCRHENKHGTYNNPHSLVFIDTVSVERLPVFNIYEDQWKSVMFSYMHNIYVLTEVDTAYSFDSNDIIIRYKYSRYNNNR